MLQNQGYNFEHNYGHGEKYLCSVMAMLMMLAFLVDQIVEISYSSFQLARKRAGARKVLWQEMTVLFKYFFISDWDFFYSIIINNNNLSTA